MRECKVYTFNVGQGLFNLMIGTANDGELYTAVFDCGNFNQYQINITTACDMLHALDGFTKINNVIISHQDEDHWRNFIVFMLTLNNVSYTNKHWYRKTESNIMFQLFNKNIYSEAHYKFHEKFEDFCFVHYLKTYMNNIFVYSENIIFQTKTRLSVWKLNFKFNFSDLQIILKFNTDITRNFDLNVICNDEQIIHYNILEKDLHQDLIDIIFTFPDIPHENICTALNKIYSNIKFHFHDLMCCLENAHSLTFFADNIYLGGLDRDAAYCFFTLKVALFALKKPYNGLFYLSLRPDLDLVSMKIPVILETKLLNHKGDPLENKGNVYKNATSLVACVEVSDYDFLLFPGDATVHTFTFLKQFLSGLLPDDSRLLLFLAPHHGSCKTNFAFQINSDRTISICDNQPLVNLLHKFPPEAIHISAEHTKFGHPSKSFLDVCTEKCMTILSEDHDILYCPDNSKNPVTVPINKAVFSTESSGDLPFIYQPDTFLLADKRQLHPLPPRQLPSNDMFLSYGGFNL